MYQRIVCFSFLPGTDPAAIAAHTQHFARLADVIPAIASYRAGPTFEGDFGAPPAYAMLHYLTFREREDIDRYFEHPAHQEFVEAHKAIRDQVLVLNAVIDTATEQPG